ncbi:MAG: DNA repair protein RadA [Firmicutes bacterium]|nr:DNA repair protein RadA [Bacillota bacterium]
MAKRKSVFVCQECGYESPKWMGQCICGAWNSFVEEAVREEPRSISPAAKLAARQEALPVSKVEASSGKRIDTGIKELNRVLGGGIVEGSLTLISGEPGIGKSTIITQAAAYISQTKGPVLYVSGEESAQQIKLRADRICKGDLDNLYLLSETDLDGVAEIIDRLDPVFLIIDSIQTMYTESLDAAPGSVSQVRACGNILMSIGKGRNIPVFIVAQVTKSGELAGPKIVEHMVDTVLSFSGERSQDLRILRCLKNRFGTTSEIGAFEMREEGLVEIDNLSGSFLEGLEDGSCGAVATAVYEGTRPLLLEIQALTSTTNVGFARRTAIGISSQRLAMIIAVLEKKAGLTLINRDVYVNIVGGLHPEGTSTDLAVAAAIWSDEKSVNIPSDTLIIGEIGLTGDLRPVQGAEKLLSEASRLGFRRVVLPKRSLERMLKKPEGLMLTGVKTVSEALHIFDK